MKILSIRLMNLASLEGESYIDFTGPQLAGAGIFAITGPTGAGKSTLLDAICLALYGDTPRHAKAVDAGAKLDDGGGGQILQNDPRNILRIGTAHGFAEVVFSGIDGKHYRAKWSVRRAYMKASGKLQDAEVELFNISDHQIIADKKKEFGEMSPRLVGLTFEQFTRSVLLAQGDFATFLKANKAEKAELLEKLTGTDVYSEISKAVFEKNKQAKLEMEMLRNALADTHCLADEEREAILQQQAGAEQQIAQLKEMERQTESGVLWHGDWAKLRQALEQAETGLAEWQNMEKASVTRRQQLLLADRAQSAKRFFEARKEALQDQAACEKEFSALAEKKQRLAQTLDEQMLRREAATKALQEAEAESSDLQPLLDKARQLEALLGEKQSQLEKMADECRSATAERDEAAQRMQAQTERLAASRQSIIELESWEGANGLAKQLAANAELVFSKLTDARQLQQSLAAISKNATKGKMEISREQARAAHLEGLLESIQKNLINSELQYDYLEKEIQNIDIESYKTKEKYIYKKRDELTRAEAAWRAWQVAQRDSATLDERLEATRNELAAAQEDLSEAKMLLGKRGQQKEQAEQRFLAARLVLTDGALEMRAGLKRGAPCPVCGSTEHPFEHSPVPILQEISRNYEKEHHAAAVEYENILKKHTVLESRALHLEEDELPRLENALSSANDILWQQQSAWLAFGLSDVATMSERAAEGWFQERKTYLESEAKQVDEIVSRYELLKNKAANALAQLHELEKTGSARRSELAEARNALSAHKKEVGRLENEQSEKAGALLGLFAEVKRYVADFDENAWRENPLGTEESLRAGLAAFLENTQRLAQLRAEADKLEAALEGTKSALHLLEKNAATCEGAAQQARTEHALMLAEHKAVFGGEMADQVRQRLHNDLQHARKHLESCLEKVARTENEVGVINAHIAQTAHRASGCAAKIAAAQRDIDAFLSEMNLANSAQLDEQGLGELLELTDAWREAERTALAEADRHLERAQTILRERQQRHDAHLATRTTALELSDLLALRQQHKHALDALDQERLALGLRLRQDADRQAHAKELRRQLDAKTSRAENWQRLDDLIGSADGKKFRQIAQEYTLDILIAFANEQLQVLAKRYRLSRVPNSLALSVTDRDMGDESRTVHSLSGGESFLVSLSLAIALSDMSSSNMQVESLFIDEGFGALDANALAIATDALERLHAQGRKVGIISHVAEVTERVPVQIRVVKLGNGRSKIDIVG
jgi:exonuclease SbcC